MIILSGSIVRTFGLEQNVVEPSEHGLLRLLASKSEAERQAKPCLAGARRAVLRKEQKVRTKTNVPARKQTEVSRQGKGTIPDVQGDTSPISARTVP